MNSQKPAIARLRPLNPKLNARIQLFMRIQRLQGNNLVIDYHNIAASAILNTPFHVFRRSMFVIEPGVVMPTPEFIFSYDHHPVFKKFPVEFSDRAESGLIRLDMNIAMIFDPFCALITYHQNSSFKYASRSQKQSAFQGGADKIVQFAG